MGLRHWSPTVSSRKAIVLTALVTTFAGVGLLIDRPKGTVLEWFSIPLLATGGTLFLWAVWPLARAPVDTRVSLASRMLRRLTFDGRLVRFFPAIGMAIIIVDLAYNVALSAAPSLQTEDTIVILAGVTLLAYCFIPTRFGRERDFTLL